MANRLSSLSMSQDDDMGDYEEPPDSLRRDAYIATDNSDDSCKSDNEQEERSEVPSNQTAVHGSRNSRFDTLSANNDAVRPDSKEFPYKSQRLSMPVPPTPLESSLNQLVMSDSTAPLPANGEDTRKDIYDHEQMDEYSSSSDGYEKIDFGPPDIENLQEESPVLTNTKSTEDTQKDTQGSVQEDTLSNDSDGYVIEQINFEPPATDKMQSPYLDLIATSNETDNSSGYYDWCEVKEIRRRLATAPVVAASKSGASVEHSQVHRINHLPDRDTTCAARQSMDTDDTVALTRRNTIGDTRSLALDIKQPELQRTDSAISSYVQMHRVNNPTLKEDSDISTYDYVDYGYVEMCKRRRRCSGVPPRRIKRIGYQPSIPVNVNPSKEPEVYVNFKTIEKHTISVPPRENHTRPTEKQHADYKPPMPLRNIPRPKYFLSAPPSVPKVE